MVRLQPSKTLASTSSGPANSSSADSAGYPPWHQMDLTEGARGLAVEPSTGLSENEAARRLRENGSNELQAAGTKSAALRNSSRSS